jgi:hypothetical protein
MFLTAAELAELTGKDRGSAQCRVLNALGIPHRRRPDGKVIVLREAAQDALFPSRRKIGIQEPDWGAVR